MFILASRGLGVLDPHPGHLNHGNWSVRAIHVMPG
jgi:hypothetical protein